MSQGPHRNGSIVGSHAAKFSASDQGRACPQICGTEGGENTGWPGADHEDVRHLAAPFLRVLAVDEAAVWQCASCSTDRVPASCRTHSVTVCLRSGVMVGFPRAFNSGDSPANTPSQKCVIPPAPPAR